jgi:hypothetical protein
MKKIMMQDDNSMVEITLPCDDPHIGAWLGPVQCALGGLGYHNNNIEEYFGGEYYQECLDFGNKFKVGGSE